MNLGSDSLWTQQSFSPGWPIFETFLPELKTVLPNADFVLEGYVDPTEPLRDEGPFGDHTGYYTLPEPYPVFHVIQIGGVEDHVHLLARFGRTITQAEWVKELKRVSNLWLKERSRDYADFEWQGGYADFSVSQSKLEQVKQYIAGQEEHHRKIGFQDELRALLKRHEIEWDEKYVWD